MRQRRGWWFRPSSTSSTLCGSMPVMYDRGIATVPLALTPSAIARMPVSPRR